MIKEKGSNNFKQEYNYSALSNLGKQASQLKGKMCTQNIFKMTNSLFKRCRELKKLEYTMISFSNR